jgi:hypothetical protein
VDRERPCHVNMAEIAVGAGLHAYALLCYGCGRLRGRLPKAVASFFCASIATRGEVPGVLTYRDATR